MKVDGIQLLIIIGIVIFIGWHINNYSSQSERDKQIEPFQAHINEYTSSLSLVPSEKESYVSGKVITVDMANNKIDQTYFELSPDMAARSPNEVDSLVRIKCEDHTAGYYTRDHPGYRIFCEVTVIDLTNSRISAQRSFYGSPPPSSTRSYSRAACTGSRPTKDIADWLEELPHR